LLNCLKLSEVVFFVRGYICCVLVCQILS
jgi:hypothetical protein